ncbi:hypothetical protein B9N62_07010 [Campylobacter concisus]|uniref:Uncharacterized protein n=1 Tax=Campylobacter concisus TaxID=199 RepID=A0A1Y5MRA0_9BACT|nr:hypothetical protein [Campylobacter concisus]OUT11078.1 hypothetical protein B9N62_07010 [Campylobacter concisus]
MRYIAKGNICVKGNFVKEGEIITLNQNEAKKYLDASMIEAFEENDSNTQLQDQDKSSDQDDNLGSKEE